MTDINENIIKDIKRIQEEMQEILLAMMDDYSDKRLVVLDVNTVHGIDLYLQLALKYIERLQYIESEGVDDGK